MGKPSIFSKEYEKRMKRRKRNIIVISLIVISLIAAISIKFLYNPIDYGAIKQNIQDWIDSDTILEKSQQTNTDEVLEENSQDEPKEEPIKAPEEDTVDINLVSGKIAKAVFINENGEKKFTTLKDIDDGVTFDISPSGKQILVNDKDSTITVYNVDGSSKIISKDKYVATNGRAFTKESTIQNQPQYLWNSNPKFLSEEKIIFTTNRPYFGTAAVNQYLWITDIASGADTICWNLKSTNIEIGQKEEKGIKVTINGNIYYIDENGGCIQ